MNFRFSFIVNDPTTKESLHTTITPFEPYTETYNIHHEITSPDKKVQISRQIVNKQTALAAMEIYASFIAAHDTKTILEKLNKIKFTQG